MEIRDSLVLAYDGDGEPVPAYAARPVQPGEYPGVIVIQEWWGLDEHIKDVARRFAREGFVVLAPELYRGQATTEPDEARKLAMDLDRDSAAVDLQTSASYLLDQQDVKGPRVAAVGFCMGGGLALLVGCKSPAIGAVVDFYGRPLDRDTLKELSCAVLGLYGEADQGIPPSEVEALKTNLAELSKTAEFHVYPEAPHAFFNDTRPSYRPGPSADAWGRTLTFLRQNL